MRWDVYIAATMLASLVVGANTLYLMAYRPRVRTYGLVTILGIVAFPVAVVLHNVISGVVNADETVSFLIGAVIAPGAITIGALGIAFTLGSADAVVSAGFALAGLGLAIFPLYVVGALIYSAAAGPFLPQEAFQYTLLPASLVAVTTGAMLAVCGLATASGRQTAAS